MSSLRTENLKSIDRSPEHIASVVRGVLISRLDDLAHTRIRPLCEEYGFSEPEFIRLLQEIQLALFPEEFGEPDCPSGLVPRDGRLSGVGIARLQAFAQLLLSHR